MKARREQHASLITFVSQVNFGLAFCPTTLIPSNMLRPVVYTIRPGTTIHGRLLGSLKFKTKTDGGFSLWQYPNEEEGQPVVMTDVSKVGKYLIES